MMSTLSFVCGAVGVSAVQVSSSAGARKWDKMKSFQFASRRNLAETLDSRRSMRLPDAAPRPQTLQSRASERLPNATGANTLAVRASMRFPNASGPVRPAFQRAQSVKVREVDILELFKSKDFEKLDKVVNLVKDGVAMNCKNIDAAIVMADAKLKAMDKERVGLTFSKARRGFMTWAARKTRMQELHATLKELEAAQDQQQEDAEPVVSDDSDSVNESSEAFEGFGTPCVDTKAPDLFNAGEKVGDAARASTPRRTFLDPITPSKLRSTFGSSFRRQMSQTEADKL